MTGAARICYLVFCAAIAALAWLAGYGLALRIVFQDGRILEVMTTTNPFAPLQQLLAYPHSAVVQKVAAGAALPALALAGMLAYCGLKAPANPLGAAAFQDRASLRRANWFARRGKIFGRFGRKLLRSHDDRHHLVIGPTRSGKGVGYVIPNALMHQGSMVVTDLKGEIFASTAGYRARTGSEVFFFAPGAARSHRYNPIDFIRSDRGNRTTDIQNIAAHLVPESAHSENAVWQATAQQVMAGAISYIAESAAYQGRRNLAEVNAFFNSGHDLQELMRLIKQDEPNLSRFTVQSFNAYIALSERTAASALLDVQNALRPFKNERIAAATTVSDFDLKALGRRATSIYLAPSITDVVLLKPLLSLFVQQALDVLTIEHDPGSLPVYFLLDEFRQLKKMTEITTKLPYVASHNVKFAFVIQDLKSLDEIYGENARHSLVGNCGHQLVFGANDQATAEYVSRALGKKTVRYTSVSRTIELMGLHRRTEIEQIRERDLMMAQEVRQMPMDRMVLLVEGQKPIYGQRLKYFTRSPFRQAERYARNNVPDVPEIAFYEPAAVPAATNRTAGGRNKTQDAASMPTGGTGAGPDSAARHKHEVTALSGPRSPDQGSLDDPATRAAALEVRLDDAAMKLKALTDRQSDRADGRALGPRDWSAIFDEAVSRAPGTDRRAR
jgi:type IV secretion system protein VirD4